MTFEEYISNPMGKKNAVYNSTVREMYKTIYSNKLDNIMLREAGHISHHLYKSGDDYIVHIKVPSETVSNFYYDVVIHFHPEEKLYTNDKTINRYDVKFFSNDPSFVFNFCHAFVKNKMFFTDIAPKMNKEAMTQRGEVKNPGDTVMYVKSLFFAYLIMKNKGLFNRNILDTYSAPYDKKKFLSTIAMADDMIQDRQAKAQTERKKKREEREQEASIRAKDLRQKSDTQNIKYTKNISPTMKSKNIRSTKTTKRK